MTGESLPDWGMHEADDCFHEAMPGEPAWTETLWFAFMVPERRLLGYVYPAFRPNLGLQFGGVKINFGDTELPWEIPVYDWTNFAPLESGTDLRQFTTAGGVTVERLAPGGHYRLRYDTQDCRFDLRFDGIMQPMVSDRATGAFVSNGHIDQPGRVHGKLVLHGETIAVDCLAMRDRGWGPRKEGRQVQMGYMYAVASPTSAFLTVSGTGRSGIDKVIGGFLMRDGVWSRLVSGERRVVRDRGGRSAELAVTATDELGREFTATGKVASRFMSQSYASMLCWAALVEWQFDGATVWGEDQDCWGPRLWRDFARSLRS